MAEIIERYRREEVTKRYRRFDYRPDRRSGYRFPVDENDQPYTDNEAAADNLRKCLNGELDVIDMGIIEDSWTVKHPAILRCDCGHELMLQSPTNTCVECEADYNMSGQRLAPREQWGEETGETASEILRGGHYIG